MYKFLCYTAVSGFGVGYFPFASGTAGSFATLPFALAAAYFYGVWGIIILALFSFVIGVIASKEVLKYTKHDPSIIIIDEVVGQLITFSLVANQLVDNLNAWWAYIIGFFLFRLFDIWKPQPARWADSKVINAWGVMLECYARRCICWGLCCDCIIYYQQFCGDIIMVKDILKLIRVKQWVKNSFVLAPLLFSLKFTEVNAIISAGLAFAAFCFVSSVVYVINDILDRKKDALHFKKKNRPIASGRISPLCGIIIASVLFILSLVSLLLLGNAKVSMVIGIYIVMNILYSYKLKQLILIDVFIIAFGFILRVYAGAYAIEVPVSSFIFMTTLFLSLFLGYTKRKGELICNGSEGRAVLEKYSLKIIDQYIIISATLTIMCYALYTLEPSTIARFSTNRLIYSVIFVIYGILRYIHILSKDEIIEDPTEILYKDKGLIGVCILYVLYVLAIFVEIV